jgi:uncharacterized membrane protein YdbT with pleckstrin-like domain
VTGGEAPRAATAAYRGVWRILADWFRVPRKPPSLPAGPAEHAESFRPSPGFLKRLKLQFWIVMVVIDVALLVLWIASFFVKVWLGLLLLPVLLVVAFVPYIIGYVAIHLRFDTTWYVLSDRSMRIRRGIWTIRETTITYENIQNVKVTQGPIQRLFDISNLLVETAGGGGRSPHPHGGGGAAHLGLIEGVTNAAAIRDMVMARVRRSRTAGLGDEHEHEHHGSPTAGWSAAHVEALRAIRSEVQKMSERLSD